MTLSESGALTAPPPAMGSSSGGLLPGDNEVDTKKLVQVSQYVDVVIAAAGTVGGYVGHLLVHCSRHPPSL